jgi:hypothetical protein
MSGIPWKDEEGPKPLVPEEESAQVDFLAGLEAMARAQDAPAPKENDGLAAPAEDSDDRDSTGADEDAALARAMALYDEEAAAVSREDPDPSFNDLAGVAARLNAHFGEREEEERESAAVPPSEAEEAMESAQGGASKPEAQAMEVVAAAVPGFNADGFWVSHDTFDSLASPLPDEDGDDEEAWDEDWHEDEAMAMEDAAPSLAPNAQAFTSPRIVQGARAWPPFLVAPFGNPTGELKDAIAVLAWPPEVYCNDEERAAAADHITAIFKDRMGRHPDLHEIVSLWWKAVRRLVKVEEAYGRPDLSPNAFCYKTQLNAALSFLDAWEVDGADVMPALERAGFPLRDSGGEPAGPGRQPVAAGA